MKKTTLLILLTIFLSTLLLPFPVRAGFGVSPPDVINDHLTPGSHFEKTIYLSRGKPTENLIAEVTIEDSEIKNWITIDKGMKFSLPKGEYQVPMNVIIDVPEDAAHGSYGGYMRVRQLPAEGGGGQVTTLLGVRIDIDLVVSEKGYSDFNLKGVSIPNFAKGSPLIVMMILENVGNTKIRPTKIHLDIYDISHKQLLISGEINDMTWIEPFETGQSTGQINVILEPAEYWADVTVYKEGEPLGLYKTHFMVVTELSLGKEGTSVSQEDRETKEKIGIISYLGTVVIFLIALTVIIIIEREKVRKMFTKKEKDKKNKSKKNKK